MNKKVFENQKLTKVFLEKLNPKIYEEIQGNNNMVKRLIFHNVEFLEYEVQYIFFLKEAMEKRNIIMPKTVDYGTLLRFLYSNHFDKDKTCEDLKKHFQWLLGVKDKRKQINDKIFAYFEKNFINFIGRDLMNRPIILFNLKLLGIQKANEMFLLDALEMLFINAKKYLLSPGYIEKWIIIIDLTQHQYIKANSFDYDITYIIPKIKEICQNFPETLEKVYIINPDKNFYDILWKPLETKDIIPKFFKEKLLFFSHSPDIKILGFAYPLFPIKELSKYIDPAILPDKYDENPKNFNFPNLLNGIHKKPSSTDNLFQFNDLLSELQALESEKKKKQNFKDLLTSDISNYMREYESLMLEIKKENNLIEDEKK